MAAEFGSVALYEEMGKLLNTDEEWLNQIGSKITYSMAYEYGDPVNRVFFVNFDKGRVDTVKELDSLDGVEVDFVISGSGETWRGILTKEINPTTALTRGQLKVKGKMATLLKNMSAFTYIINKMMEIELVG